MREMCNLYNVKATGAEINALALEKRLTKQSCCRWLTVSGACSERNARKVGPSRAIERTSQSVSQALVHCGCGKSHGCRDGESVAWDLAHGLEYDLCGTVEPLLDGHDLKTALSSLWCINKTSLQRRPPSQDCHSWFVQPRSARLRNLFLFRATVPFRSSA
jgi:hypothetical protein